MATPSWYSRLPTDVEEEGNNTSERHSEKNELTLIQKLRFEHVKVSDLHPPALISFLVALFLFGGIVGFLSHAVFFPFQNIPAQISGTAPQVPIGYSVETFQYDKSFAAPPTAEGSPEPIWDALIPNGLGYVKDDPLAGRNLSVISAFHQLHCLYTLRRAYYSNSKGGEDFDFGLDRAHHAGHCFEYLRQSLMCSADSTVEPAEDADQGFLGWGFQRQCRNYDGLKEWAETWRAFDGHGFLANPTHRDN